ncbi:MAG: bifunctional diaminohydroxyphosphoribosylaminopyrimidine deaminase/5-amino-6-(5-phosphoribosylamino)uracil reductase RibD [bacterium]
MSTHDINWMTEAIRLARLGEGLTRPNPPVGAVIVRNGRCVGRGWHRKAGGSHAEVYALRQAVAKAEGATLYVTLEPCSTWGRTPPCCEAIIKAGIKKVVVAVTDPNPRHSGKGFHVLRRAGIEVVSGIGADEARDLLAPFASSMIRKRPTVTLKLAESLDGRIADAAGRSKWITGSAARDIVQELRRRSDAVLVGAGTVMKDDPSLLPRPAKGRQPFRIIVDASGKLPATRRLFSDGASAQTILATTKRCSKSRQAEYAAKGVQVLVLPSAGQGVSLPSLMRTLHALGVMHVLCEGGGELAGSLLKANLVDEVVMFVAPMIIGGDGKGSVGGKGWPLAKAPRLKIVETRMVGHDVMIRAKPEAKSQKAGE